MADEHYANVRNADILGPIIGATIVDITQQDPDEFAEDERSYVALHFSNGYTVTFPIGEAGFDIADGSHE